MSTNANEQPSSNDKTIERFSKSIDKITHSAINLLEQSSFQEEIRNKVVDAVTKKVAERCGLQYNGWSKTYNAPTYSDATRKIVEETFVWFVEKSDLVSRVKQELPKIITDEVIDKIVARIAKDARKQVETVMINAAQSAITEFASQAFDDRVLPLLRPDLVQLQNRYIEALEDKVVRLGACKDQFGAFEDAVVQRARRDFIAAINDLNARHRV